MKMLYDKTPAFLSQYGTPEPFDKIRDMTNEAVRKENEARATAGLRATWQRFPGVAISIQKAGTP